MFYFYTQNMLRHNNLFSKNKIKFYKTTQNFKRDQQSSHVKNDFKDFKN